MFDILINDEIAQYYGITPEYVRERLSQVPAGETVRVLINSPGGSMYAGISIFNQIREYAKTHEVVTYIEGMAASMGAYIAVAAKCGSKKNKITCEDNSVFMVHNPYDVLVGNFHDFYNEAQFLERASGLYCDNLAKCSNRDAKAMQKLMDDETWLFGKEIVDGGFADEVIQNDDAEPAVPATDSGAADNSENSKAMLVASARRAFATAQEKIYHAKNEYVPASKIAALLDSSCSLPSCGGEQVQHTTGEAPRVIKEESMTLEELKAKEPAVYAQAVAAGVTQERNRVNAHLTLGETAGDVSVALKYIKDGSGISDMNIQAEYIAAGMKAKAKNDRIADNPPAVQLPGSSTAADAQFSAFCKGLGVPEDK